MSCHELLDQMYDVGSAGKNKRFINFEHLLRSRGLNGSVELSGLKLTRWQVDGLRDYINSNNYRSFFSNIDEYELIIVSSYKDSDLSI